MPVPPPPVIEPPATQQPQPRAQPKRARPHWWTTFPWPRGRTRNAAPLEDDRLTIDNETALTWTISVQYHALEPVGPFVKRQERVVKTGLVSARPLEAAMGTDYLTTYLNPRVRTLQIRGQIVGNQPFYDLRLVETP
jgi:hypothetical protein